MGLKWPVCVRAVLVTFPVLWVFWSHPKICISRKMRPQSRQSHWALCVHSVRFWARPFGHQMSHQCCLHASPQSQHCESFLFSWARTNDLLPQGLWSPGDPEHSGLSLPEGASALFPFLPGSHTQLSTEPYITAPCISILKAYKITSICEVTLLFPPQP